MTVSSPAETTGRERRLLWLMQLQFESNCLSSVAIEIPALRPAAEALRKALG